MTYFSYILTSKDISHFFTVVCAVCAVSVNPWQMIDSCLYNKTGKQCIHVSAIWKFNNYMGKKAMYAS